MEQRCEICECTNVICDTCHKAARRWINRRRFNKCGGYSVQSSYHTPIQPANLDLGGEKRKFGQEPRCKYFKTLMRQSGHAEPTHVVCGLSTKLIASCRCNSTCKEYVNAYGTAKIGRAPQCKE